MEISVGGKTYTLSPEWDEPFELSSPYEHLEFNPDGDKTYFYNEKTGMVDVTTRTNSNNRR